jgi:hypothetical protein
VVNPPYITTKEDKEGTNVCCSRCGHIKLITSKDPSVVFSEVARLGDKHMDEKHGGQ